MRADTSRPPAPGNTAPVLLLTSIAGVYMAQSVVTGVAMQGLPALLRSQGASLQQLGLVALLMLPWALKFLWAPWIERLRLPGQKAYDSARSRHIVMGGQLAMAAVFALIGISGPMPIMASLTAMSLATMLAASIDVACDGYAIERSAPAMRGWVNVMQVGGSYAGLLLGGGLFLLLAQRWGMPVAWLALGALIALLASPWLWRQERLPAPPVAAGPAPALRQAWCREPVRAGLALTVLLAAGPRLAMGLTGPVLLDHGLSLQELAWLQGAGGVMAGVLGALLGGVMVRRWQACTALAVSLALQASSLLILACAPALTWMAATVWFFSLALPASFVASYTLLMRCAEGAQPGVDFTLFQCADACMAVSLGMVGGWLAQHAGYTPVFSLAGLVLTLACTMVALRRVPVVIFSGEKR